MIEEIFLAQTGPNPYFILLTYLTMFWNKYFIVVVTDRGIVLLKATIWKPTFPKGATPVVARLPRGTRVGPLSGLWGSTTALGEKKAWIHKRFHKDVAEADGALGADASWPAPTA